MPENLQLFDSKEYQKARYALALINIKSLGVKTFTYSIPDDLKDKIQIGQAIFVPFGRQGYVNAFVSDLQITFRTESELKKSEKFLTINLFFL